jgi:hypothetical protein
VESHHEFPTNLLPLWLPSDPRTHRYAVDVGVDTVCGLRPKRLSTEPRRLPYPATRQSALGRTPYVDRTTLGRTDSRSSPCCGRFNDCFSRRCGLAVVPAARTTRGTERAPTRGQPWLHVRPDSRRKTCLSMDTSGRDTAESRTRTDCETKIVGVRPEPGRTCRPGQTRAELPALVVHLLVVYSPTSPSEPGLVTLRSPSPLDISIEGRETFSTTATRAVSNAIVADSTPVNLFNWLYSTVPLRDSSDTVAESTVRSPRTSTLSSAGGGPLRS